MDIQYTSEKKEDILIFTIKEDSVNHNNAASLKEKLFVEISQGNTNLVLDLHNVKEMDSSGLGALLFGKRQANSSGGNIVLVSVDPSIQSMIRIAQLARVFEMTSSVEEALEIFKK